MFETCIMLYWENHFNSTAISKTSLLVFIDQQNIKIYKPDTTVSLELRNFKKDKHSSNTIWVLKNKI